MSLLIGSEIGDKLINKLNKTISTVATFPLFAGGLPPYSAGRNIAISNALEISAGSKAITTAGTVNAYTATLPALNSGDLFTINWHLPSTGDVNLNNIDVLMLGLECPAGFLNGTDTLKYNGTNFEVLSRRSPFVCSATISSNVGAYTTLGAGWQRVPYNQFSTAGNGAAYLQASGDGNRLEVIKPCIIKNSTLWSYVLNVGGNPVVATAIQARKNGNSIGDYRYWYMAGNRIDHTKQINSDLNSLSVPGDYIEHWLHASASLYVQYYQANMSITIEVEEWS